MAHFLIFDSKATMTNRGEARNFNIAPNEAVRHSTAVRLFGSPDGDTRQVGFEFNLLGTTNLNIPIRWCLQFFNDRVGDGMLNYQAAPDSWRDAPVIGRRQLKWTRECVEIVGGAGAITHYPAARLVTLNPSTAAPPNDMGTDPGLDSVYFPMTVHAMWVRVAVWQNTGDQDLASDHRFLIFAVVGGYSNPKAMEETTRPYEGQSTTVLGD